MTVCVKAIRGIALVMLCWAKSVSFETSKMSHFQVKKRPYILPQPGITIHAYVDYLQTDHMYN